MAEPKMACPACGSTRLSKRREAIETSMTTDGGWIKREAGLLTVTCADCGREL